MSSFTDQVKACVKTIPTGETRSYSEVAASIGHPGAQRAVAQVMAANFDPDVPCHRVIRADGQLGGYNRGGIQRKQELLQAEQNAL